MAFTLGLVIYWCIAAIASGDETVQRRPVYKYRYETEDLMKTAASSVPVHGYHLAEGGYYPEPRFGNFGGFNAQPRFTSVGGLQQAPFLGVGLPHHQHHHQALGGAVADQNSYQNGHKQLNDATFQKANGGQSTSGSQDQEGYQQGVAQVRNDKAAANSYSGARGEQAQLQDNKHFSGGENYAEQGSNSGEQQQKQGHKKNKVVKGFKTSHHKDETGHTEEYYDESSDEGGNAQFKGAKGSFGQQAQNAYRGGHENGQFKAGQSAEKGHQENVHVMDNANADKGDYANRQAYGQAQQFAANNGVDQQSLLGHQEASRFFKHQPFHNPFYNGY